MGARGAADGVGGVPSNDAEAEGGGWTEIDEFCSRSAVV